MKPTFLLLCFAVVSGGFAQTGLAQLPTPEQVLPREVEPKSEAQPSGALDFNLDGTLSMQGFARAKGGKFPQLLQDLDLAFSALWKPDQISYYRFGGSIIDRMRQRPFYVAAASETFFQSTKEYEKTQIEKVFSKTTAGHLNIVMTDLFEQDLDINSIQQALNAVSFPEHSSLAVWQWDLPFDGAIYDYDFRVHKGRIYKGNRHIYMLALGSKVSIEQLRDSVGRTVTVGAPHFLLLSKELVALPADWFRVTQTEKAALKSRSGPDGIPVYRISRGCDSAELTAMLQLSPAAYSATEVSFPGSYGVSLFGLESNHGRWSAVELNGPQAGAAKDKAGRNLLHVKVNCAAVSKAGATLVRIRRIGTDDDVKLPDWVPQSSATNAQFNDPENLKTAAWGEKTLNLLPFLRELATRATKGTIMATAYVYLVAN